MQFYIFLWEYCNAFGSGKELPHSQAKSLLNENLREVGQSVNENRRKTVYGTIGASNKNSVYRNV